MMVLGFNIGDFLENYENNCDFREQIFRMFQNHNFFDKFLDHLYHIIQVPSSVSSLENIEINMKHVVKKIFRLKIQKKNY